MHAVTFSSVESPSLSKQERATGEQHARRVELPSEVVAEIESADSWPAT